MVKAMEPLPELGTVAWRIVVASEEPNWASPTRLLVLGAPRKEAVKVDPETTGLGEAEIPAKLALTVASPAAIVKFVDVAAAFEIDPGPVVTVQPQNA